MRFSSVWQSCKSGLYHFYVSLKWVVFSVITGAVVGLCGVGFSLALSFVTDLHLSHGWLLFLLPAAGLLINGLYSLLHNENDSGTNLVISSIHSGDELPFRMAPSIFLSTLLTHLCGGSAGREGAALQMGGSVGGALGGCFHFDEKDRHVMILCGMSAAFSALFGTPMTAAVFSMEMVSVGVMYYNALVPCVVSSLVARGLAGCFSVTTETYLLTQLPAFTIKSALFVSALSVVCAIVSILFCVALRQGERLYARAFPNKFIRIFIGGCLVILVTILIGSGRYGGSGSRIIEECMRGEGKTFDFLLKMLLTVLCIGAGYKGGEIVPTLCIGAAFGCLCGQIFGFSPALCAAVGMVSLFCGVTNCPISSLLLSFELFGFSGMPYFLLATAFSYMFSGYFGLYRSQKILYSKYKSNYINRKTQ